MSPFARACRNFALTYLVAMAAIIALTRLLQAAGLDIGGAGSIVPLLSALFAAGAFHAEREGVPPPPGLAWRFALAATGIAAAVSAAALAVMTAIVGEAARAELRAVAAEPLLVVAVIVVLAAVHVLAARFLFPFAARLQLRGRERRGPPS